MLFTKEEKVELFDKIAERYYDRNFGTMLKADIDTLIFSTYIEHCMKYGDPYDDYTLSIELGITESRVRSLKERKQLQYPYPDFNWKDSFVVLISKAKYNDVKHLVQMNIQDVNLMKEVRHFVYVHGWFDEFQLNPKLFQCRLDFFVSLCKELEENSDIQYDEDTTKQLKLLAKNDTQRSAIEKIIDGDIGLGFSQLIKEGTDEIITELLRTIPFCGIANKAIKELIKVLAKHI
ncbi:MAG: hypothetical protein E7495_03310 [Ruminococcus flavefaciens]|jgi:hypothetical protein|nr:hypothetical protein [Ruminococcus flavefaciens]